MAGERLPSEDGFWRNIFPSPASETQGLAHFFERHQPLRLQDANEADEVANLAAVHVMFGQLFKRAG